MILNEGKPVLARVYAWDTYPYALAPLGYTTLAVYKTTGLRRMNYTGSRIELSTYGFITKIHLGFL